MKLVNINIEGNKHFETVIPFLQRERPDTVCLQEVFKNDLHRFEELGYTVTFFPEMKKLVNDVWEEFGCLIGSFSPISDIHTFFYRNADHPLPNFYQEKKMESVLATKHGLLGATVTHDGHDYRICTTHFTWTPHGPTATPEQVESMKTLLAYTKTLPHHILTGDFNIPRGQNPLYNELVKVYKDNIPLSYASSMDPELHYSRTNPELSYITESFMVDYVFTQPSYVAKDVRLKFGISDHAAVIATLSTN